MFKDKIIKARTLLESLPYIRNFHGHTMIIKYGGSLMVNDELKLQFARDIVMLKYVGINPVIIHGGGKEITKWMKKVGKESLFIDGLRVTDGETIEITEMVLTGKINSEVVSLINQQGGKAVGLSGKSANLFTAKKRECDPSKDLGFVGDIEHVDTNLLTTLSSQGYIPVISSIGVSSQGETLNMNADHVAEGIAVATKAKKLIYLTDVNGIMIDGEMKGQIPHSEARALLSHPDIKGGMLPKLTCTVAALDGGVNRVHIINGSIEHALLLEVFTDTGIGTMIFKSDD